MTLAIQAEITRDPGPMTLAIHWPHPLAKTPVPGPMGLATDTAARLDDLLHQNWSSPA